VVLLATAVRQGRNPDVTLAQLKRFCGVWRSTVKRWHRYFREIFPKSRNCRRLSGRLMPPIDSEQLPGALLARFNQAYPDAGKALIACLQTFALGP